MTLFGKLAEHPAFAIFWDAYPRKIAKGTARKAFGQAIKKIDPDRLIAAVKSYRFSDDQNFVPHPATWLNGERWDDQPDSKRIVAGQKEQDLASLHPSLLPYVPKIRARIGDANLLAWFGKSRLENRALVVRSRFVHDTIYARFSAVLRDDLGGVGMVVEDKVGAVCGDSPAPCR